MADVELNKITFYASEDSDVALQLTHIFIDELKKQDLYTFFSTIEMPLISVLLDMEFTGMYIDPKILSKMSSDLGKKIDLLKNKIIKEAGIEFNINSTQQLANILFDDIGLSMIKKRSTAEDVLERLKNEHIIPDLVLQLSLIHI